MERYSPSRISAVVLSLGWVLIALVGFPQTADQDYDLGWKVWVLLAFATLGPLVVTNILWFRSLHRIGAVARDARREPAAVRRRRLRARAPLRADDLAPGRRRDPDRGRDPDRPAPPPCPGLRVTSAPCRTTDFMPLDGWDHLELWVGNAKQAAYWYEHALGFERTAYAGPETGVRDRASYVLEQGEIRLVLTSGVRADSEIVRFAATHGDARQGRRAAGARRGRRLPRGRRARRARGRGAALGRGRARPRRARHDRDLRRERPHLRQPRRVHRPVPARLRLAVPERVTGATASA